MKFKDAQERALEIQRKYRKINRADGHKEWTTADYMSGFVKDVGDLSKLIMVNNGLRGYDGDLDHDLKHEIGDCFWSLFIICSELGISPEGAIETTLSDLEERLKDEV